MANMSTHKYGSKGNSLILGCEFVALTTLSQILGIWHHEVISSGNLTHSVKNSCDPNITHTMNYSWTFLGNYRAFMLNGKGEVLYFLLKPF